MKPDRSQVLHLVNDPVMRWLLQEIRTKFPPLPPHCLAKSWDHHNRLVGQQEVLQEIRRLLNDIPDQPAASSFDLS